MHLTFDRLLVANTKEGGAPMEKYLGIGFIILCVSVLVGIAGILRYQVSIHKEKVEISPATEINQSKNTTDE